MMYRRSKGVFVLPEDFTYLGYRVVCFYKAYWVGANSATGRLLGGWEVGSCNLRYINSESNIDFDISNDCLWARQHERKVRFVIERHCDDEFNEETRSIK